jgi:hypothetical protein
LPTSCGVSDHAPVHRHHPIDRRVTWTSFTRVSAAAARLTPDYEIVLVNDGSPDDSSAWR